MAKRPKKPAVVAELGRPETPEETAARKAESSRLYRARKTINNLAAALGVSLLAVAVIVFMVPRDDSEKLRDVDFHQVASEAQPGYEVELLNPEVPSNWQSNQAEIRHGADGVSEWYIGFMLLDGDQATEFVGLSQGINANDTWTYEKVDRRSPTGSISIDGNEWIEYDYTDLPTTEAGNTRYSLVREDAGSTIVLYGSHTAEAVQELASRIQ
ncbi:DUF4245 family protein [Gulosibacter molinativorax]|uniref:DUF4245 domain-containing protein n=1 Tax=Gulosibacter molinativorax TaxID=256821 RepID=A0ABT7C813_9MICO|nr:DUF4245 family protein [Gulosibacter molinativorax]MDJ1370801.1 DUF4245 domain-containing protein [Gulosibacter molinativorax]QUY62137.1 Putative exported protein [Gulosibacter molinativorax]